MIQLFEPAYAKVNLTLDVLSKRPDGYHDLQSVMQTLSLQDDITIVLDTGNPWVLTCSDPEIPCDERNLAWKAAKLFLDATGHTPNGLSIHIEKRIPSQAGLGGGSSDAAAVLRALNRYYGSPMTLEAMADLSAAIGSDIPFCVLCGTAMAEGRGELLRKLPDMPMCDFVLCKPDFPVSTPALYKKLDETPILRRPDNAAMERAIREGSVEAIAKGLGNVFDPVVSADHPEIDRIKEISYRCGAIGVQMSGSGSAVFAIFPNRETAAKAKAALEAEFTKVYTANPISL